MEKRFAVIILAAGNSVRLGRPKQFLLFDNETLLERIIRAASSLDSGPVIIVLNPETSRYQKDPENIITVINEEWQEGMASSIRTGIAALLKNDIAMDGVILSVCDQPHITTSLLRDMISKHRQTGLPIIACSYDDTVGTPVFFHHSVFPELMQLKGDKGAKAIIKKEKERVGLINFPLGNVDIDTEEDYLSLQKKKTNDC